MSASIRVADHIFAHLAGGGVSHVFGVDGADIEDLFDAAHFCTEVTAVPAQHEFSAAAMAAGYSRSGAGLGVVMTSSGGAALNVVSGLAEALTSGVPMLALIGQPSATRDPLGTADPLRAETVFSAVSVFCERVDEPADILTALPRAIIAACAGGPAVLLLPRDIQRSMLDPAGLRRNHDNGHAPRPRIGDPHPLTRALRHARGPVTIIAGGQVARDDARAELEGLRAVLRAGVACVPDAKDVAGCGSPSDLGVTGVVGHPSVAEAVAHSALCLLVGTRLPPMARAGLDAALRSTRIVSLGSAPPHWPCTHVHTDDLQISLAQVRRALAGRPLGASDPMPHTELTPPPYDGAGVRYRPAMQVLDRVLPDDVNVVVDTGNAGAAALHYLPARRGGRFLVALGMAGMGYSFGAAIGMAIGRRRRTVVIAGDGAFYRHGMEVHTAIEHRLPVTFVLFNNNAHAMCGTRERLHFGDQHSYNRFRPSRLGAGLSSMFPELSAVDVSELDALAPALTAALAADGPSVVSVECSADEIPPFAPFLAAVEQPAIGARAVPGGHELVAVRASA